MSVIALGNAFASELHRSALKQRGFKKKARTFTCEHADYTEMLQIQGSDWNSGQVPWLFYINIRVRFNNLPSSFASRGAKYDADGRIERIVLLAPPRFELTNENLHQMVALIAKFSVEASARLPELLLPIRGRASQGLYSPIPLPETWQSGDA